MIARAPTSGQPRVTGGALGGSPRPAPGWSHGRRAPARLFDDQAQSRKDVR
jgi:hypothetical protein